MAIWGWEAVFDHKREMLMAGFDMGEGKRQRKEIGVWHLPAPHLPEQLLLIVYPHLPRDKNELEREEESSLSQSSQPRGEICGTCCTLTPGWLHSLVASLISWMRREGEKIKSVIERRERERKCAKEKKRKNNLFLVKRVREFEVIFSWLFEHALLLHLSGSSHSQSKWLA